MTTQLRVTTLGGDCHAIDADVNWSIKDVKLHITTITHVPYYQQRLLVDTRILQDVDIIKDAFPDLDKTHDLFLVCCEDEGKGELMVSLAMGSQSLRGAEQRYREDPDVVSAAVRFDGMELQYALGAARKDRNIVLAALARNGYALDFAKEFQEDREAVLIAVASNSFSFTLASANLQQDAAFAGEAVKKNPFVEDYVERAVKDNPVYIQSKKRMSNPSQSADLKANKKPCTGPRCLQEVRLSEKEDSSMREARSWSRAEKRSWTRAILHQLGLRLLS
jgi:hypothetical protein